MKTLQYLKDRKRLAVAALRNAELRVLLFMTLLVSLLWALEVRRLVSTAKRIGWTVRFVPSFAGDVLGEAAGMAIHRDKIILVRTTGMTQRMVAEALRHELEHAGGTAYARATRWLRCGGTWGTAAGLISLGFETVAGSTLSCTVTAPVTYDLAGYSDTDIVWTEIGEITDLGQGYGREYNIVSHAPIASSQVVKKKGGYNLPQVELALAWDQSDAGQDLLRTARNDNSILTFKLTKQGGDKRYFTAQVSKFVENFGTVDNVVVGMVTLLFQKDIVSDPA